MLFTYNVSRFINKLLVVAVVVCVLVVDILGNHDLLMTVCCFLFFIFGTH